MKYDLATESDKTSAKMELAAITAELMPSGKPLLTETVKYPQIAALVALHGRNTMMKILFIMVKEFCSSVNVVRNMNEDQQIEAAAMLLDECGNFRLEDYQIMFAMGKRGQFPAIKLMDRVDIQFISAMMDEYWQIRHRAGKQKENEVIDGFQNPANPVPVAKVNELFESFGKQLKQVVEEDELKNATYATNRTRKSLDEVIDNLKQILPQPNAEDELPIQ